MLYFWTPWLVTAVLQSRTFSQSIFSQDMPPFLKILTKVFRLLVSFVNQLQKFLIECRFQTTHKSNVNSNTMFHAKKQCWIFFNNLKKLSVFKYKDFDSRTSQPRFYHICNRSHGPKSRGMVFLELVFLLLLSYDSIGMPDKASPMKVWAIIFVYSNKKFGLAYF